MGTLRYFSRDLPDISPAILPRNSSTLCRADHTYECESCGFRRSEPAAKLATACQLSEATAAHSLGAVLGLGEVDEDELYAALDLLGRSRTGVEKVLAQRHLEDGVLVLYDVTSSYLERLSGLRPNGRSRSRRFMTSIRRPARASPGSARGSE